MKDNQRTVVTKRMLREGLLRLLKTKSLDKINIVELCNEAGINRTTFYRHYELPKDILYEMQAEFMEEMRKSMKKPQTEHDFEQIFIYLQDHSDLVKLFIRYNSDEEWTNMFRTLHHDICDAQILKDLDSESEELFYTFLAGGTYFLLRQWLIAGMDQSPKEVADIMLRIINKKTIF